MEVSEHYTNTAGGTHSHFFMEEVNVLEEQVVTRGRDALRERLGALNWERLGIAAPSNVIAWYALEVALV